MAGDQDRAEALGLEAQLARARQDLAELAQRGHAASGLLEQSRRQAEELVEWLERAIAALGPGFGDDGRPPVVLPEPATLPVAPLRYPRRRRAAPLPPGMRDDQPEAVASLLRNPASVLLVDGYNVSMAGWPDSELADQRARLVRELAGLAARTGAEVRVVFDGSDEVADHAPTHPLRGVSVSFTRTEVEADDVIVELIDAFDPARVVVVASGDRQVQLAAGEAGANVVSPHQLLAALGRH